MNRLFSVTRRRPHIIDLSTLRQQPTIPTQDGYRISVATNFDGTFSDIIDSTNVGFLDRNVNQAALDVQSRPGQIRIVFDPDTYTQTLRGQEGTAATVSAFGAGVSTLTGLTGMTASSVGHYLTITGANTAGNNGTFLISVLNSATSVDIVNAAGASPDANDGSIVWAEHLANIADSKPFWMRLQPLVAGAPSGDPGPGVLVLPDEANKGLGVVIIQGNAPEGVDSTASLQISLPTLMRDFQIHNRDDTNSLFVSTDFEGQEMEFMPSDVPAGIGFEATEHTFFVRGGGGIVAFSMSFTFPFPG